MARLAALVSLIIIGVGRLESFEALEDVHDHVWDTNDQGYEDVIEDGVEYDVQNMLSLEKDQEDELIGVTEDGPWRRYRYNSWIPINLIPQMMPKADVEKKRNRIPLEWKGYKKTITPLSQKILPESLKMFFTRMKPKLSDRLQQLKQFN